MFNWFKKKFSKNKYDDKKEEITNIEEDLSVKEDNHDSSEENNLHDTISEDLTENISDVVDDKLNAINESHEEEKTIEKSVDLSNNEHSNNTILIHKDLDVKKEIEEIDSHEELNDTKESVFKRFLKGVNKTRKNFTYKINSVFNDNDIDDDFYEELEEVMVMGDIGAETTMTIIDILKDRIVEKGVYKTSEAKELLKDIIIEVMNKHITDNYLHLEPSPAILMLVGVNGVGKTTTCGKLAYQFKQEGKSVAIIAADTFRAAAIEQLEVWGDRAGVKIISQKEGSDPAAVVFDGLDYSVKNNIDITIIDTAGRLHNKVNLMNELNKIKRIIDKKMPNASMEVILALDATTGQNALLQVKEFKEAANITGVSLNKLDGTAKGGVIIPIQYEEKIPVKIVGVGESIYDLQPFEPQLFVDAIFE